MTKTNRIAAAIALIASTVATGCAVDSAECADQDCSAIETEAFAPEGDFEVAPNDIEQVTAEKARDPQLKQYPRIVPPLQDWVLRMEAGAASSCDIRLAGFVAGEHEELTIEGCENSIIAEILPQEGGRPVAAQWNAFNAEETKWMLLGLDISQDAPLTVEEEGLLAEADAASFYRTNRVTAEAVNELEPRFAPENM